MLRSPCRYLFTITFVLCWAATCRALLNLEDVFEVRKGAVPGSCDEHLDLLGKMFEEVQKVNENARIQLQTDNYNQNEETRKLAKSIFGISPSNKGKEPGQGVDFEKLEQARRERDEIFPFQRVFIS